MYTVATAVYAYRKALDLLKLAGKEYRLDPTLLKELDKISHRPYSTGFLFGRKANVSLKGVSYSDKYLFVGIVQSYDLTSKEAVVGVRNQILLGQSAEVMQPKDETLNIVINEMVENDTGWPLKSAHANSTVRIPMPKVKPMSIIRVAKNKPQK